MTLPVSDVDLRKQLLAWQKTEISEYHIYHNLARTIKDPHNRQVIEQIADSEAEHARIFQKYTGKPVAPDRLRIFFYYWIARLLGLTFGVKLMERGEESAQAAYAQAREQVPEIRRIFAEEEEHENQLIAMLDEEALRYAGSVVLGLNDALVELTGALAGLTFAFQNTNLIALTGLITGISASFSMAASEYLSTRAEGQETNPLKSALYTGLAYIFTVLVLVLPYLLLENYLLCLAWTLANAILVIAVFNFYIAVVKDLNFGKRFMEMALISLGVAAFSFGVGYFIRTVFGIEI
ncbi:MAG: VIT1/CCC1 transporter family protein [Anaerolineales bacterium]|nr:VIT1/CCC1 transporter family protein [Anaerolineales bacterium]